MNKIAQGIYDKTKGYKAITGFIITFVAGGLVYTKVIDAETGNRIIEVGAMIIAFGLGDKIATKMN